MFSEGLAAPALYLVLALASYHPSDPGWSHTGPVERVLNQGGVAGAWLADVFYNLFGYMAFLFPIMLGYRAWLIFRERHEPQPFDDSLTYRANTGLEPLLSMLIELIVDLSERDDRERRQRHQRAHDEEQQDAASNLAREEPQVAARERGHLRNPRPIRCSRRCWPARHRRDSPWR